MVRYIDDFHTNNNPPTLSEFESWTIKKRHDLIKKDFQYNIKRIAPNDWAYLFYPKAGYAVRFKTDRKHQISGVETVGIDEANRLCDTRKLASDALLHNRN